MRIACRLMLGVVAVAALLATAPAARADDDHWRDGRRDRGYGFENRLDQRRDGRDDRYDGRRYGYWDRHARNDRFEVRRDRHYSDRRYRDHYYYGDRYRRDRYDRD